ncbi:hypothetical protein [Gryllotalpicola ginsengisoli]|uniref:hypothetical protein n=1 Tax=Gryllotalpicola ginsengisoli TaxID=444608 RepID=UPI0012DC09CD|nr:hypothetical protein [Gryllotalpicola ginsengisoli]
MTHDDAARLLGLDPPRSVPRPDAVAVVRAALDGEPQESGDLDGLAFPDFLAAVAAAAADAVRRLRRSELPEGVLEDSLADVGRKVRLYGDDGIRGWLIDILRGEVIALGRLQFERRTTRFGRHIHIPELGPLDPGSVDAALDRARRFFADGAGFCCASWMLDPRLLRLGDGSNIVRFQRRFRIVTPPGESHEPGEGDRSVAKFVFRRPLEAVLGSHSEPASSLQRLVLDVLRSGEHWTEPLGVLHDSAAHEEG